MGEDVTALGIGAQLDLVDRQELDFPAERHGFHSADEIGRPGRDDLLLACDQGDGADATRPDDAVVDFPGQKPQGQPDHARGMAEHPLHGQVGFPGVGRAQNRHESRGGGAGGTLAHVLRVGWESSACKREGPRLGWVAHKFRGQELTTGRLHYEQRRNES